MSGNGPYLQFASAVRLGQVANLIVWCICISSVVFDVHLADQVLDRQNVNAAHGVLIACSLADCRPQKSVEGTVQF
jgi:hypothetical protein